MRIPRQLRAFLRDQAGATAIEYGLIVAFIAIAIVAGARLMADETISPFDSTTAALTAANS